MRNKSIVTDDSGNALYKNMAVHTEEKLFQPVTSEPFKVSREVGAIFYRFTDNADFTRSIRTIHVDLVYGDYFSGTVSVNVGDYLLDPQYDVVGVAHTHPLDQGDWLMVGPNKAARALDTSVPSLSDARFDKRIDMVAGRDIRSWLVTTSSVLEYQGY
jgi:hypothetical protein